VSDVLDTVFDIGDRTRLGNHAASAASAFTTLGVVTDPTALTLTLLKPDATETVWAWPTPSGGQGTATKEATGRFYADHTWDQTGIHWVRLAGTGAVVAAVEFGVYVRPQRVS
jgi:hypothetical protein